MDDVKGALAAALRGLDYPATRNKLMTVAMQNGAPPAVIERLGQLPETADFVNEDALEQAVGIRVHGEHPHGWE